MPAWQGRRITTGATKLTPYLDVLKLRAFRTRSRSKPRYPGSTDTLNQTICPLLHQTLCPIDFLLIAAIRPPGIPKSLVCGTLPIVLLIACCFAAFRVGWEGRVLRVFEGQPFLRVGRAWVERHIYAPCTTVYGPLTATDDSFYADDTLEVEDDEERNVRIVNAVPPPALRGRSHWRRRAAGASAGAALAAAGSAGVSTAAVVRFWVMWPPAESWLAPPLDFARPRLSLVTRRRRRRRRLRGEQPPEREAAGGGPALSSPAGGQWHSVGRPRPLAHCPRPDSIDGIGIDGVASTVSPCQGLTEPVIQNSACHVQHHASTRGAHDAPHRHASLSTKAEALAARQHAPPGGRARLTAPTP